MGNEYWNYKRINWKEMEYMELINVIVIKGETEERKIGWIKNKGSTHPKKCSSNQGLANEPFSEGLIHIY
jgi:hypothetical protein